jgi:hypothetical protein
MDVTGIAFFVQIAGSDEEDLGVPSRNFGEVLKYLAVFRIVLDMR